MERKANPVQIAIKGKSPSYFAYIFEQGSILFQESALGMTCFL